MAYQGYGRGVSLETLHEVDSLATGRRNPDHTLLFDLPAEVARQRGHSSSRRREPGGVDRLDAEGLAFYERVRQGYLALAADSPERIHIIDSSGPLQDTRCLVDRALGKIFGVD